jgi:hypothetical protein
LSAAKGKQIRSVLRSRCERRHVDDEAIANILAHDPFDRSVDVLDTNELDVGLDVPGRAVVDDFPGFSNSADQRVREALAAECQRRPVRALELIQNADI